MSTPRTYALLVGIDKYPAPISPLDGCRKDVRRIKKYLIDNYASKPVRTIPASQQFLVEDYGQLVLCVLEDEQATYNHIICAFREHLQQARASDVVWFHFSGHGTENYTAVEFKNNIEPNGKDQNLVCYQEEESKGQLLIADKELAVLLHEVATADASGRVPHILVSLDCCHSGSGTREVSFENIIKERIARLKRPKSWEEALEQKKVRPLATYLDGYFLGKNIEIPIAKHILLSACTSIQTAADTIDGGVFTNSLLAALNSSGQLNYADVFIRTRAKIRALDKEQLPQFETIGGFDPYTRFLQGTPLGKPDRYELQKTGNQWLVKCGAIHGLPVRPKAPIAIEIIDSTSDVTPLGNGFIIAVGAQMSKCELPSEISLDPDLSYQAVLRYLAFPPILVNLHGDAEALQPLVTHWDESAGVKWVSADDQDSAEKPTFRVEAENGQYLVFDEQNKRQVLSIAQQPNGTKTCMTAIGKMARWERTILLDNPKSSIRDRVQFSLDVLLNNGQRTTHEASSITLESNTTPFLEKDGALFAGFIPKVKIVNTSQQLFLYLFHLRNNYSIDAYEGEHIFRPFEHSEQEEVVIPLLKQPKGWGLSPGEKETFSYFKLLVTTEKLDYFQLLQSGLEGSRDTGWLWAPVGVSDEWFSSIIKVRLVRS